MNKVKIFHGESYRRLEEEINMFAERYDILNTSITTEKHGYSVYYTIVVVYKGN